MHQKIHVRVSTKRYLSCLSVDQIRWKSLVIYPVGLPAAEMAGYNTACGLLNGAL